MALAPAARFLLVIEAPSRRCWASVSRATQGTSAIKMPWVYIVGQSRLLPSIFRHAR